MSCAVRTFYCGKTKQSTQQDEFVSHSCQISWLLQSTDLKVLNFDKKLFFVFDIRENYMKSPLFGENLF